MVIKCVTTEVSVSCYHRHGRYFKQTILAHPLTHLSSLDSACPRYYRGR